MLEKRTNAEAYLVEHGIDKFENDTILDKEADVAEVTFSFPRGRPSASFLAFNLTNRFIYILRIDPSTACLFRGSMQQ